MDKDAGEALVMVLCVAYVVLYFVWVRIDVRVVCVTDGCYVLWETGDC